MIHPNPEGERVRSSRNPERQPVGLRRSPMRERGACQLVGFAGNAGPAPELGPENRQLDRVACLTRPLRGHVG